MSFNIAFILFPDFEELDLVGPYEVMAMTAKYIDTTWRAYSVAETMAYLRQEAAERNNP